MEGDELIAAAEARFGFCFEPIVRGDDKLVKSNKSCSC